MFLVTIYNQVNGRSAEFVFMLQELPGKLLEFVDHVDRLNHRCSIRISVNN